MTKTDIAKVMHEIERVWRTRTPATRVDEVDPGSRVTRGEVRAWCKANGVVLDEMDMEFTKACIKLFRKLKKEFPEEKWAKPNSATTIFAYSNVHGVE